MISTAKPRVRVQQQNIYTAEGQIKFRLFWNRYSDRVATFSSIENPYHWENGFCTYLGFPTKAVAMAWQQHLLRIGVAASAEYRKVNRLAVGKPKNCAIRWELKVRGLTYRQLLHLLTFDLTQVPPQQEKKPRVTDFEICDRVKIVQIYGNPNDRRVGGLGSIERTFGEMLEVRADGDKYGTLLLKPEWAVKVDAIEFPLCCELPEPIASIEPQLEQSEVVEVEQVDVPREVAVSHRDRDVEECLATELKLELAAQPEPQAFQVGDHNTEESLAAFVTRAFEKTKSEIPIFEVGDRVEVDSNRHGDEFVWEIGIVSAASKVGCAVNVKNQLRWFCNDELRLVEKAPQPREAKDDLFPPVSQDTTSQLPAYNPYPLGRRGAVANWKARQASGHRLNLTADDGMDKWRRIEQEQKLATALASFAADDDDDDLPF